MHQESVCCLLETETGGECGKGQKALQDQCLNATGKEHAKPRATCHKASGLPSQGKT